MIDARIPNKKPFEKSKGQILEIKKSFKKSKGRNFGNQKIIQKIKWTRQESKHITILVILLEHRTKGWNFIKIEISRCLGIPTSERKV